MFKVNHKNSIAIVIYFHNCSFIFDDFSLDGLEYGLVDGFLFGRLDAVS